MAADPDLIESMRAAALRVEKLVRRSARARAGTDSLPAVRAARLSAAPRTRPPASQGVRFNSSW